MAPCSCAQVARLRVQLLERCEPSACVSMALEARVLARLLLTFGDPSQVRVSACMCACEQELAVHFWGRIASEYVHACACLYWCMYAGCVCVCALHSWARTFCANVCVDKRENMKCCAYQMCFPFACSMSTSHM